jgi:lysophospholipase L1-like esterase
LALLVAGLALGLALAEWLLGGPLRPPVADLRDTSWKAELDAMHAALHQADPALVYAPRPGASVEMPYGTAAFDARGLRPIDSPVRPDPAARTVAVLGDSLVWGELLGPHETLPAALQGALGADHRVLNAGVTGFDTAQEAAWYRRAVRPLQPDVVVLVVCLNDLLIRSGPFHPHATRPQREAHAAQEAWLDAQAPIRNETVSTQWLRERRGGGSQVLAAARHVWRWHRLYSLPGGYTDDYLLSLGRPERVAAMRAALDTLGADLRADGAAGALVISPGLYGWHRYPWGPLHAAVGEAGRAAGFTVLDPITDWGDLDPEPFRFAGDNLHYTADGADHFARWLAPRLRTVGDASAGRGGR